MEKGFCDIFDLLCRLGISADHTGFFQTACAVEPYRAEPERPAHKPLPQRPYNAQFLTILLYSLPIMPIPDETE